MNPTARRHTREYLLQAMYQWQISHAPITEIETQFVETQINKKIDLDYFKELIHGIPHQKEALDECIRPFLDRPITELDPIELAIIRLSTYELAHRPDIPYRVVINEGLELAKKFGSIEGYKFVNGILDKVARRVRATEIRADKSKGS